MTTMIVNSQRVNSVAQTTVQLGNLQATMKSVNDIKKLSVTGRGNVRQIKTITKSFHRVVTI